MGFDCSKAHVSPDSCEQYLDMRPLNAVCFHACFAPYEWMCACAGSVKESIGVCVCVCIYHACLRARVCVCVYLCVYLCARIITIQFLFIQNMCMFTINFAH